MSKQDEFFMKAAIELAYYGINASLGNPFGAVIVHKDQIVGKGYNQTLSKYDPTAHAEVTAIRDACDHLKQNHLTGCIIYTSCEPCPMCLGAIYWAKIERIFFACSRDDAAAIGYSDSFIYDEIGLPLEKRTIKAQQILREDGLKLFNEWTKK